MERVLAERLRNEGLDPGSWSSGPGDAYSVHQQEFDKVLVCERGSITFDVGGQAVALAAGDRLELPAGTPHRASVGPEGVVCLEAHLPAGRLGGLRHRLTGEW